MSAAATPLDHTLGRRLPKVLLHDHLDGGLRPTTVLELAEETGYHGLPTGDPAALAAWFRQGGGEDLSLERYIEAYDQTLAVMQTAEGLRRVAYEAGADLAADGVIHAETRFAPALHTRAGLTLDEVLEAVTDGVAAARRDHGISMTVLATVMRTHPPSTEVVEAAARWTDAGVVGVDLAGPEAGYPAERHADAFRLAEALGLHRTVHAGEADGPASILAALDRCSAERIGHGIRIADEVVTGPDGSVSLGPLAERVRAAAVTLEVCPTSNLHTGAVDTPAAHPIDDLHRHGFAVTVNTDGRLMDDVGLSDELVGLGDRFGWTLSDAVRATRRAAEAAFLPYAERAALLRRIAAFATEAG